MAQSSKQKGLPEWYVHKTFLTPTPYKFRDTGKMGLAVEVRCRPETVDTDKYFMGFFVSISEELHERWHIASPDCWIKGRDENLIPTVYVDDDEIPEPQWIFMSVDEVVEDAEYVLKIRLHPRDGVEADHRKDFMSVNRDSLFITQAEYMP